MKRLTTFLMALLLTWIGANAQTTETITLQNPSFEEDEITNLTVDGTRASESSTGAYTLSGAPTGWTLTNAPSVCDIMTADAAKTDNDFGAPGAPSDGDQMLYLRDAWNSSATTTTLMQSVTLSAGTYKLTVDSKCIHNGYNNASTAKLVAGGEHSELPYHTAFVPENWDVTSVTFMITEETEVEIGVEIYYPSGQSGFSVLLDNFTIAEATDMELTAHYEEAEESHWSISGNTNGSFHLNTWSGELDTESGMAVPFMEYWGGAGTNLSDATIKHQQLQGLPQGNYIVSIFARAFNEATADQTESATQAAAVGEGITFTANGQSVDLTTGTAGTYGYSTEVYGVYELNCTVGSDGTLDIGFTVASETACDWMAFKDLKVVMDTEEYPTLTAPEGDMDEEVKAAMDAALTAYSNNPSGDNFFAAIEAIQDAYASIAIYAAELKGDYLIVDQEGYYLGGGLAYGTQASIIGKPQFIGFEAQTGSTYHLDSHQYNSASDHYLGSNLYFDNGTPVDWTIEAVDGGYTIYNASLGYLTSNGFQEAASAEDTPYVWTLLTMDDVVASMSEASATNPVDVTALIQAPELKRNSNSEYYPTWTVVNATPASSTDGNGFVFGGGSAVANCAESYHSSFEVKQTITLPKAGYYTLSAQGFCRKDNSQDSYSISVLYAGEQTAEFPILNTTAGTMADAYAEFLEGKHPVGPIAITTTSENETVTIGFKGSDTNLWNIMGELELLYYAEGPAHECFVDDTHWTTTSTTETITFNDWSVETDASGMRDPFLQVWVYNSTLPAQTISHEQLTGLTPGVYEVSMDIRIFSESGTAIAAGTTFNANDASEDIATGSDSNSDTYGTEAEVYGTYTLTCTVGEDGKLDINIVIPENVNYNWVSWKNLKVTYLGVVEETISWEMSSAGWGTLILPFAESIPSALTLYAGDALTLDGSTITVGEEAESIVANTPYLVSGTAGTYSFTGTPENEKDKYQVGLLVGTLADMSQEAGDFSTDGTQYVLQNHDDDGLAFYPITSESEGVTLDAYHCYLNTGTAVTALHLPGMSTGIVAVESDLIANDAIYDLSGRKVSKAVKGVYIQNGKKVLVK